MPNEEPFFVLNTGERFDLFTPNMHSIYLDSLPQSSNDVFMPFSFDNKIYGLSDYQGDEHYLSTSEDLNKLFDYRTIEYINTFSEDTLCLVLFSKDTSLYLFNLVSGDSSVICNIQYKFHHSEFIEETNQLIISYENLLLLYDIQSNTKKVLAKNIKGEKKTPYYCNGEIYFANNAESQFYSIYKLRIDNDEIETVYSTDADVTFPKLYGEYLYFIESRYNNYILKRTNFSQTETLINEGVIYSYEFINKTSIGVIMSDFFTPRTFTTYNLEQDSLFYPVGKPNKTWGFTYEFTNSIKHLSPAYIFYPAHKEDSKGIVLNFHAGLNSDFSPRWDNTIMCLLNEGYIVVSPNYPMSKGYGKDFQNSSFDSAVKDMLNWKRALKLKYSELPLYFLSSSSGNLLMEVCLQTNPSGVEKAISMFGLFDQTAPFPVPMFIVLGVNDTKVNYITRSTSVNQLSDPRVNLLAFDDEGHWFRRKKNMIFFVRELLNFIESK